MIFGRTKLRNAKISAGNQLHDTPLRKHTNFQTMTQIQYNDLELCNVDCVSSDVTSSPFGAMLYIFEVARGFEQTVSSDRSQQFTDIQLLLEVVTVHSINFRCQFDHSWWVYVEPAPEAQLDSSKVWLCKKAFQGLKISPQAWCIHSTQKINDVSYNQLISDPFHVCEEMRTMIRRFDLPASHG